MSPKRRKGAFWQRLLWSLVFPRNQQRAEPTGAGLVLVALSFGVGLAAYNSSNNILFLALSLLMASLVVSGILSWLNLRGVEIDVRAPSRATAGRASEATIVVRNSRRLVPAYDLSFEWEARPCRSGERAAVAFAPKPKDPGAVLRKVWKKAPPAGPACVEAVSMGGALQAGTERRLPWTWTPDRRGEWEVSVVAVVSLFPFGFLKKRMAWDRQARLLVRPGPVACSWNSGALRSVASGSARRSAMGFGPDLHSLRQYRHGDSHRLIHWKASARSGELIIRQQAAEAAEGCWLEFDPAEWTEGERFERALKLAAGVAERLFASGSLFGWRFGDDDERRSTAREDLDAFLDLLALASPGGAPASKGAAWRSTDVVRISPDGAEGVRAHAGTTTIASA